MNAQTEQHFLTGADTLRQHYSAVRTQTMALCEPLSPEDCCAQSMPDASPIKWHIAHTAWFFETFVLERYEPDFQVFQPAFRMLFNSYYNAIGNKHPRSHRGLLTRPSMTEVTEYRRNVDQRIGNLLDQEDVVADILPLIELGLHHEQQHQELMLTDVKHLLSCNPMQPAYVDEPLRSNQKAPPMDWLGFDAGVIEVGHSGIGFCFDNEMPRHRQFVEAFQFATRLVTNGEYLAFVRAGGYSNPALWLSEGWDWAQANRLSCPLYWRAEENEHHIDWFEFTLHGLQPLDLHRPVTHLSYFEADAYARWAGARLPTEAEWEIAAGNCNALTIESLHPQTATERGLTQMFGTCWQWTSSSYAPYPGYSPAVGAIGEYNGKFMSNQYVLRGSSCVTPFGHTRKTYRNFFPAAARWQFSGIRLARS
ncbi:MAG: ergothioneine biosynthesis protein EgtB [Burkholderiales bacterium]|nr:ergothioneine biosynthesis protein EgtB [Burkholderiales bacterium]